MKNTISEYSAEFEVQIDFQKRDEFISVLKQDCSATITKNDIARREFSEKNAKARKVDTITAAAYKPNDRDMSGAAARNAARLAELLK